MTNASLARELLFRYAKWPIRAALVLIRPKGKRMTNSTTVGSILDPKLNNFTFLRLLAALAVVISHAVFLRSGNKADEIFSGASVYNLGDHAVNVFFFLSGLTVAASLDRSGSVTRFMIARVLRIFPGLIACTGLMVLLGIAVTDCPARRYLMDTHVLRFILATASSSSASTALPGVFIGNPHPSIVNAPLWTLKYELLCYLALALTASLNLFDRARLAWLLPLGWVLTGAFLLHRFGQHPTVADNVARFWFTFSFGVGSFVFRDRIKLSWVIGLGLAALMWLTLDTGIERLMSPIATGYVALLLGSIPLPGIREFSNRIDLSYGVYIVGWPISQTLVWLSPGIGTIQLVATSIVLALGLAALSWHLIEKPSLRARGTFERLCGVKTRAAT